MTDLVNYTNIYADLAQAAYTGRTVSFPDGTSIRGNKYSISVRKVNGEEVPLLGGENLSNKGIVYLQPAIKIPTHTYSSLPTLNDSNYNPKILREAAA
ncbi:hypothetical protein [Lactovum odontotermitis]